MVRYLGYTNEVGEAFRSQVPVRVVHVTYGVASCYVFADAIHKGHVEYKKVHKTDGDKLKKVSIATTDCLVWQGFASVAIPGFTINRVCTLLGLLLKRSTSLSPIVRHWTTTIVGLACIPFIVKPIDDSVEYMMNKSLRKLYTVEEHIPSDSS